MKSNLKILFVTCIVLPCSALAETEDYYIDNNAPVVNYADTSNIGSSINSGDQLNIEQQLMALNQQLTSFHSQNLLGKFNEIQKEMQFLRGIVDVQKHDIDILKKKLNDVTPVSVTRISNAGNSGSSTVNTAISHNSEDEINEYNRAFAALKDRNYNVAVSKLNSLLKSHPQGKYTANAHYWLGEIYLLQGKYDSAEANFRNVITENVGHSKVPDAMLKLAMVYVNTQNIDKARSTVAQLQKQYPNSTASRMASIQLGNL